MPGSGQIMFTWFSESVMDSLEIANFEHSGSLSS